ncbi:hypothetical protein [Ciceribacter sp. T2.26MG-112.2]|uniref:hypothetical protein n=1 Tax=Ciceribacter sp. T2.26MG-112.2 TaxID=3137154 RepID=UPI0012B6819F|nr:hypothetical protein [Ciceribacter naphthalenivorans]
MSNELAISNSPAPAPSSGPVDSGFSHGNDNGSAAVIHGDLATRKAEIEQIMRTDFHRYEMEYSREYLQILKTEMGEVSATDLMAVDESRNQMTQTEAGRELVRSWERYGGFKAHLSNVQKQVSGLVSALGNERAQRAFMERFDRSLPEPIRYAIYENIALGAPTFVVPAADEDMTVFAEDAVGKALVSEWGSDAATKVATIYKRCDAVLENLNEHEQFAVMAWFGNLPDAQMKTICKLLAGDRI